LGRDETKVDETEETLVGVVGTDDDELEDDDRFGVMMNPGALRGQQC
jgi:hypothetical protein